MKKNSEEFTIVIDTREQRPYSFQNSIERGLRAGDYSLAGAEDRVAIERKSKSDAYGTIGAGRGRFIRELELLSRYEYAAIVIECSLSSFMVAPARSELNPKSAINSLIAWSIRYGVHVFFADNRTMARALTYRILEKFYRERSKNLCL